MPWFGQRRPGANTTLLNTPPAVSSPRIWLGNVRPDRRTASYRLAYATGPRLHITATSHLDRSGDDAAALTKEHNDRHPLSPRIRTLAKLRLGITARALIAVNSLQKTTGTNSTAFQCSRSVSLLCGK